MIRFLLAVDGSEVSTRATRRLLQLAKTFDRPQAVLVNVQPAPRVYGHVALYMTVAEAEVLTRRAGERVLEAIEPMLVAASLPYERRVWLGDTAEHIVRAAEQDDCALVAMGTHGLGAVGSLLVGSTTMKVVAHATRPVLVVPPGPATVEPLGPDPTGIVKILLAVDGSEHSRRAANTVIAARAWFKRAPEIHVLTVSDRLPLEVAIAGTVKTEVIDAHHAREAEAILSEARTMLEQRGLTCGTHRAVGMPAVEIHRLAKALHCDLLVVGTRGLGAIGGLVFGSTTAKLLHLAESPVLLVP